MNVEAAATIGSDVYGIHIHNYVRVHSNYYSFIRLEENAPESVVYSLIQAHIGPGAISYVLALSITENAWSNTGDKVTSGTELGWLRCLVNGTVRYIQLYRPDGEETPDAIGST